MTSRRLFDVRNIALVALIAVAFVFFEKLSNTMLLGGFVVAFALASVIVWMAVKRVAAHGCDGTEAVSAKGNHPGLGCAEIVASRLRHHPGNPGISRSRRP